MAISTRKKYTSNGSRRNVSKGNRTSGMRTPIQAAIDKMETKAKQRKPKF